MEETQQLDDSTINELKSEVFAEEIILKRINDDGED
jgi:hypothetical protein